MRFVYLYVMGRAVLWSMSFILRFVLEAVRVVAVICLVAVCALIIITAGAHRFMTWLIERIWP